jgi:hypothetical protein
MRLILSCALLALCLPATAEIYKYTDAKGNTVFTNQPPDQGPHETVKLPPANTIQSLPSEDLVPPPSRDEQASRAPYQRLELGNLPTEEALRANNGNFSVTVELDPPLAGSHQLRLLLDGAPYGEPSHSTRLSLVNVDRGEHSLAVEVLSNGESIQQSPPITFSLQRVHLPPAAQSRPKPAP